LDGGEKYIFFWTNVSQCRCTVNYRKPVSLIQPMCFSNSIVLRFTPISVCRQSQQTTPLGLYYLYLFTQETPQPLPIRRHLGKKCLGKVAQVVLLRKSLSVDNRVENDTKIFLLMKDILGQLLSS
jgi:hypothetical protein